MYKVFEAVINRGGYKLDAMISRIDQFTAENRLTLDERARLEAKARENAQVANEIDSAAMLLDHEMRLQALEKVKPDSNSASAPLKEYTPGTPTVAGAHWLWEGVEHEVINATPEHPCVWPPDQYPYYWRRVG